MKCSAWSGATAPGALLDPAGSTTGYWEFGPYPAVGGQSITQYNWYPINFYDAREGEPRDVISNDDSCTTNGVMNAVEIDVGNLRQWLKGTIGKNLTTGASSGPNVDYRPENGYLLYFSDRRGMLYNPNVTGPHPAGLKSGDSGLEDVVNSSNQAGTPDGALETAPAGAPLGPTGVALSPEDVHENGVLDNWGSASLGLGFYGTVNSGTMNLNYQVTHPNPDDPYGTTAGARIASCGTTGRKNWVSGARHVLKLVDGALDTVNGTGNLPITPVATSSVTSGSTTTNYYGGFTVASENPVYVQGDYNSSATDTFFTGANGVAPGADEANNISVPAAIVADAVTLLSDSWDDRNSTFYQPTQPVGNRTVNINTYYRMAIAGGKNMAFPFPTAWANTNPDYPFGTDGGVGNFLRFLEDYQSPNPNATLNYGGSLVSLYYSTYATGIFKC